MLASWKKSYDQPRQHVKRQRHFFANKGSSSQGYGVSSGHVWMWELYYEESWVLKNWCFWTVVLEKTLESPLDYKEIQSVHPKGYQPWVFSGRNDAKAETPVLWPPHVKSWLIGKDSDVGRDWGQEEKGTIEDEMAGWHHRLDGREFEWTLGVGDGQGGLVYFDSWGRKESDTTERLNWTELHLLGFLCGLAVKNPPANAKGTGDVGSVPGSGRSPGEGNGNLLQYSCLENPMAEEPGWVQSIWSCKSQRRLSD